MSAMKRLNLNLSTRSERQIEDIRERLDASSASEVIRRAVACLDVVTRANEQGATVVLRWDDGTERQISLI